MVEPIQQDKLLKQSDNYFNPVNRNITNPVLPVKKLKEERIVLNWPWENKISRKEALLSLEYQDRKLKNIYRGLRRKAESSIKSGKPLEGKVYSQAASKVAKSRALILHKICEFKAGIIEGEVSAVLIKATRALNLSNQTIKENQEMKLQKALEEMRFDLRGESITEEMLDDALREMGYQPEDIQELVQSEIDSNIMNEITPANAIDSLRTKIEREISESDYN